MRFGDLGRVLLGKEKRSLKPFSLPSSEGSRSVPLDRFLPQATSAQIHFPHAKFHQEDVPKMMEEVEVGEYKNYFRRLCRNCTTSGKKAESLHEVILSPGGLAEVKRMTEREAQKAKRHRRAIHKDRKAVLAGEDSSDMTPGGLVKEDLTVGKLGHVASKKLHSHWKMRPWPKAVAKVRKDMTITGFVFVKKGTPLFEAVKKEFMLSTQ